MSGNMEDSDLDLLTSLLEENEGPQDRDSVSGSDPPSDANAQHDEFDDLFDADEDGSYTEEDIASGDAKLCGMQENVATLFGELEDLEDEEKEDCVQDFAEKNVIPSPKSPHEKTKQDLEEELKQMQEQMKKLQKQLQSTALGQLTRKSPGAKSKTTEKSNLNPLKEQNARKLMESDVFSAQLVCPAVPKVKHQGAPNVKKHQTENRSPPPRQDSSVSSQLLNPKSCISARKQETCPDAAMSSVTKSPQPRQAPNLSSQPMRSNAHPSVGTGERISKSSPSIANKNTPPKPVPNISTNQVKPNNHYKTATGGTSPGTSGTFNATNGSASVEKFSGLRIRRPRVSSVEMERRMTGRKLIRLSQLPDKLPVEKLEDSDWVTFGVIVKKITPQSANNGRTFSIWRLSDLKNMDKFISLFLFGDVHKEHWKTEQGTVLGLLNANPLKPKEGSDEVCFSVDNPQKILIMGESLDLGTCKARKKNGDPCTQTVNLNDCEYCQYHVQSQYKKLSSKRADLQSSFSSGPPKKMSRKASGLKSKLCQDGFHYGGVSSMAYAASVAAAVAPKKTIQTKLSNIVVRGADAIALEAQKLADLKKKELQCSDEFKELLGMPSPGALHLKKHLNKSAAQASQGPGFQSISASALLKQQRQQMLESRKKRAEETQKRLLEVPDRGDCPGMPSLGELALPSPKLGNEFPKEDQVATIQLPKLGRGFSEGDDILFFNNSPPPAPKLSVSAEAKKLLAIGKLRQKGQILSKANPNSIKRKLSSPSDIVKVAQRVEQSGQSPEAVDEEEPATKKKREQLAYLESEEFQRILNAKSKHSGFVKEAEAEQQERYFEPLVKKEQMEEKMRNIKEQKCRAVSCKTCNYTHFKPLESCVAQNHDYKWHDAVKRFFKCSCGNRTISLDRLPNKHCSTCGLFKWERDTMLKERSGPKIAGETLLTRGEEHGKFLNSIK
ncbi:protein MCM10 homolog [Pleurodeles waltl]|uniref:protein MCM10 homolog n=1 Tax=Pleurodeles waltl TaxID=8319 RepID=UPI0037094AD3